MYERLQGLEEEYEAVGAQLADPAVVGDQSRLRVASRRYKELTPLVVAFRRYVEREADLQAARELLREATGDDRELLHQEADEAEAELAALDEELRDLLVPSDPNDGKDVIVEIRGAEGGEEANLFAKDLYEMYSAYAARQGWKQEVLEASTSYMGGFDEVVFQLKGDGAWSHMKHEGGPHRVQRVNHPTVPSRGDESQQSETAVPRLHGPDELPCGRDRVIETGEVVDRGGEHRRPLCANQRLLKGTLEFASRALGHERKN